MNCNEAQQNALLEQTGELSGWKRFWLRRHLKSCVECREFRILSLQTTKRIRPINIPTDGLDSEKILENARRGE